MKTRKRAAVIIALAAVAGLLLGGIAYASIPGPDGVIHGCYKNTDGTLRIVDSAASCPNGYTALNWAQGVPGAWQTPTLGSGCASVDGDADGVTEIVKYRVEGDVVRVKGMARCTVSSPVAFTLPAGLHPTQTILANGYNMNVTPLGNVYFPGASAGQTVFLDGSFPVS